MHESTIGRLGDNLGAFDFKPSNMIVINIAKAILRLQNNLDS